MTSIHDYIPITSQSINSPAVVRHQILEQYRIHWFLGLRQAELLLLDRLAALEYTKSELALLEIKKQRKQLELERLKILSKDASSPAIKRFDELEFAEATIEIQRIESLKPKADYQIRDAIAELNAAKEMLSMITEKHEEELEVLSFDELQEILGRECIEAKQAHLLSTQITALSVGVPIADILSGIDPDRITHVLERLNEVHQRAIDGQSLKSILPQEPQE